ncbi:MAG: hypothetical protein O7E51_16630 [Acidobacteria bacterium]|nr:hypothetical protein [Acidobacteriota bacterium]
MKRAVWISLALLIFLPLLAQRGEDFRRRNPLEQVQNMLTEAGVPLSDEQQETLQTIMEEQRRAFREQFRRRRQEGGQEGGGERRGAFGGRGGIGGAMQEKIRGVLTAQQIEVWDNYRNQQIRRRGGFPALRLMLEEVGAPLSSERAELLQTEFREYNQQRRQLRGEGEQADPAKLQELEDQHLSKVIKLLDAEQRRALIQSRRKARGQQSD